MLINTNLYNESTDNVFSYINQINNNYNAIMEAARISELRYYNDTGKELFINESGILANLIHRIIEFFKNLLNKITSLFKKGSTKTKIETKKKSKELEKQIEDFEKTTDEPKKENNDNSHKTNKPSQENKDPTHIIDTERERRVLQAADDAVASANKLLSKSVYIKLDGYKFPEFKRHVLPYGFYTKVCSCDTFISYIDMYNQVFDYDKNIKIKYLTDERLNQHQQYGQIAKEIIADLDAGESDEDICKKQLHNLYLDMYHFYGYKEMIDGIEKVENLDKLFKSKLIGEKEEIEVCISDEYVKEAKDFMNKGCNELLKEIEFDEFVFEKNTKQLITELTKKEKLIKKEVIKVDDEHIVKIINLCNRIITTASNGSAVFFKNMYQAATLYLDQQIRIFKIGKSIYYTAQED